MHYVGFTAGSVWTAAAAGRGAPDACLRSCSNFSWLLHSFFFFFFFCLGRGGRPPPPRSHDANQNEDLLGQKGRVNAPNLFWLLLVHLL